MPNDESWFLLNKSLNLLFPAFIKQNYFLIEKLTFFFLRIAKTRIYFSGGSIYIRETRLKLLSYLQVMKMDIRLVFCRLGIFNVCVEVFHCNYSSPIHIAHSYHNKASFLWTEEKRRTCDMAGSSSTPGFSQRKVFSWLSSREQQLATPDTTVTADRTWRAKFAAQSMWSCQIKRYVLMFNPLNQPSHFPPTSALLHKIKISNILPHL